MKSLKILPLVSLQVIIVAGTLCAGYLTTTMQQKVDATKQDLKPVIAVMKQISVQRKEIQDFNKPLSKGSMAPSFTLKDEVGNLVSLNHYKGKKVMLLFTSSGDCPNCMALNPIINQLQQKRKELQIIFLMHESNSEQNNSYKQKNNIQNKVLSSQMPQLEDYHIDFLPTTVIVGKDGKIEQTFRATKLKEFIAYVDGEITQKSN